MQMKPLFPIALIAAPLIAAVPVAAMDRLPDGGTATYPRGSVTEAWYGAPTTRYDHGVLGDAVEGGALIIKTADGSTTMILLDKSLVFEDITPRLADLDGDGNAEIITIVSSLQKGGSLAVFALKGKKLQLVDQTRYIGVTHRWLNVAGIADYDGNGKTDVAIVKTPHLGGALEIWSLLQGNLSQIGSLDGVSNHVIGTRDLDLSATVDADGDGMPGLVVPSRDRGKLRHVGFVGGALQEINCYSLSGKAVGALQKLDHDKVSVQLDNGQRQTIFLNPSNEK